MKSRKEGIFYFLKKYLQSRDDLENKIIIDIPAGSGRACAVLKQKKANVKAFDIFPEFMKEPGIECEYADMTEALPIADSYADMIICQEGIEHIHDQLGTMQEFNRILRTNGELLITTPNISNFVGKLSGLVSEGELLRYLPPSEIDGIWFSSDTNKFYLGHYFLIGVQRLRNLAVLSGFDIQKVVRTGISRSSLILSPIFYPIVLLFSTLQAIKTYKKFRQQEIAKKVILEQYLLSISPKILLSKHLFLVLEKRRSLKDNFVYLKSISRSD